MARKHSALLAWARSHSLELPQDFTSLLAQRRQAHKMRDRHSFFSRLYVADINLI
jgi:hypothetical protein